MFIMQYCTFPKNFAYSCKFTYRTAGFGHRTGLAFLHRLVLAINLACVEVGTCGMRLVCLLLQLTGLNRFVGTSYETQHQVNRRAVAKAAEALKQAHEYLIVLRNRLSRLAYCRQANA